MGEDHKSMRGSHQPTSMFRDTLGCFTLLTSCKDELEGKEASQGSLLGRTFQEERVNFPMENMNEHLDLPDPPR